MPSIETITAALDRLARRISPADRRAIVEQARHSKGLRHASPEAAAWLSLIAYIRHNFTDYDDLLTDGYGQEAARHFTAEQINQTLAEWGCDKRVTTMDDP